MRILKGVVAFALVFCFLTVTVVCAAVVGDETAVVTTGVTTSTQGNIAENSSETVAPTENYDIEPFSDVEIDEQGATQYLARMHAPKKDNPYYYSDKNIFYKYGYGMPNCTAYAWGRAYEILGKEPKLCIYDAYEWFDYNKENEIYAYGQTPKLGAIACYKYIGYNSGHVAVVEKITDNTIYYSNSAFSGQEFYINSSSIDDPTEALPNSQFLGYIYIGEYYAGNDNVSEYRITSDNGVNMRAGAGTSYKIVGAIPYNKTVLVTKTAKANGYNWGYTTYDSVSGWFVTDFAKLIEDSTPSVPNTPTEPEKPTETEPTQEPTQIPTQPPQPTYLLGDVDLDGTISVMDATLIQMYLASIKNITQEQKDLCDTDGDGIISVMDSTKIRLLLAGLE